MLAPQILTAEARSEILSEFERFRGGHYPPGSYGEFRSPDGYPLVLNKVDKVSDLLFDVARGPAIMGAAEKALGGPVVPLHAEFFAKPPDSDFVSPPHQDQIFYQSHFADELAVVVWIALTEVTLDAAPLQYYSPPNLELLPHATSGHGDFDYELETPPPGTPTSVALNAGDAVIHHAFVIHQAARNRSPDARIAIGFNYRTSEWRRTYGSAI